MRILIVAVAAAAVLAAGYVFFGRGVAVTTVAPQRGPAVDAIYATGIVEPATWAQVSSLVPGRIVEVRFHDGDPVEEGDILARLDDREAQANLRQLEAREHFWQDELTRQRALESRGVASRANYERTQSEYLQAKAATAAARQRLEDFVLRAPISGMVLRRDGEVGEVADRKQVLFSIGRPKPLRVTADVDEEDIVRLAPGQAVLVKADAFPERALTGVVAVVTPKGDPINKSYRVRVSLPDDTPLLVGMTVEINIVARENRDALLVPAGVVRGGHVFVVSGGRAKLVPVEIGIRGTGRIEVVSGLAADARVVVDPPAGLADGAAVRAAPAAKTH
ncbi:MAG: efflux RND transporter periplasmic adaptor subunit [Alphaproteobacteria bacterium]|nr:efflux RND transporter periplasmic adaptor subunit [Alphaproteobacteria bacterium]